MVSVQSPQAPVNLRRGQPADAKACEEVDGEIIGSNFLDERSAIAGLGPITITPKLQNLKVGRQLMETAMLRTADRGAGPEI